ncbi:MAG: chromosome segregation protein SMC [Chitinivibrionales bacterium]|nr:chromosome segregation protein SMC [Chitinivibrionales bacterium]MBD3395828.1 chromosome segregation protein SMC [Chitinivibrionales bacterium]
MILRKLSLFGFKSFADKTSIRFGDGLTSIIGPNGCGKSNVVDAIRWVFGEQKPTMLRSSSMQDVIFSGTQKRQPLSMAEVSLTIENNQGILPVEYSEVEITRRMHRSGEGEYLINRVPCRLRDIQNLFLDTGVGSNMYTTIENAMINAILSDKAEDRRVLFEEAAGIGKYKQRIRESQRKLERTRQDLLRINDRVQEKDRYVRMLSRMVERAKRYRQYRDELMGLEVAFESRHYAALSSAIGRRDKALQDYGQQIASARASAAAAESRIEQMEIQKVGKEEQLQAAAKNVSDAGEKIRSIDHAISVDSERVLLLKENVARFEREAEGVDALMEEKRGLLSRIENTVIDRERQLEEQRSRLDGEVAKLGEFDRQLASHKESVERLAHDHVGMLGEISEKQEGLSTARASLATTFELRERDEREIKALTRRLEEYREAVEICQQQLAVESEAHKNHLTSRESLLERIETEDHRYHELVEREKRLEAQLDSCATQRRFLEGLDASFEGYESGVKALLTSNLDGVMGIVADLIEVGEPEMVDVVEKVLGTNVQTVVFKTNQDLQAGLDVLRGSDVGVARMVSLEHLGAAGVPEQASAIENTKPLRSFVRTSEDCERLADHLFNHVLVSDTADTALAFPSMAESGTVLVSRDGVISCSSGVIIAGHHTSEEVGLLQRKQEIERLAGEIGKSRREYERVVSEKENCVITRDEAKRALLEVDEKLNRGRQKQREQETTIKHYDIEMQNVKDRMEQLHPELARIGTQSAALEEEVREHEADLQKMSSAREGLENRIEQAKIRLAEMEGERATITDHLHNIELGVSGLTNQIQTDRESCERLRKDIEGLGTSKERKLDDRNKTLAQISELMERRVALQEELKRENASRQRLEEVLAGVREDYNATVATIDEARKAAKTDSASVERLSNDRHALDLDQMRDQEQLHTLRERIWEAYEVDLDSPPDDLPELDEDEDATAESIKMLKERLKRVGEVNMSALGEYESENAELQEMIKQRDDLQTAVEDLDRAIKKLNREARAKFVSTFNEVKENFTKMFATLFEGGEAFIALEENVDPLEASIFINARPAGKKMRGVTLLSGGERALTAISLLFALYMVRPSAYCILDELDAPLDDANVDRFLRILRQFSESTQFIIVTHNKRTMEAADILYGVTQEEFGVSTMASVRLRDVELQAA